MLIVLLIGAYFLGRSDGVEDGTKQAKSFDTVYIRQPDGTPLKKETPLRVIGINDPTQDDTQLRNDPNVWRIYIHEIGLVIYLTPRFVKD